jgi:hypothetical protein
MTTLMKSTKALTLALAAALVVFICSLTVMVRAAQAQSGPPLWACLLTGSQCTNPNGVGSSYTCGRADAMQCFSGSPQYDTKCTYCSGGCSPDTSPTVICGAGWTMLTCANVQDPCNVNQTQWLNDCSIFCTCPLFGSIQAMCVGASGYSSGSCQVRCK